VITAGPCGSHHVLATAVHARAQGRRTAAVLLPQHLTDHHREVHDLIRASCDHLVYLERPPRLDADLVSLGRDLFQDWPTVIPPGGSTPRGVLGYLECGLEIAAQVASGQCPLPERIYVALGSGGTAAGLVLGLALAGLSCQVRAVRVATRAAGNSFFVELLAWRALALARRLGLPRTAPQLWFAVDHRFIGPGYAHPTAEARAAVSTAADLGLELETTYTGKAFAALLADLAGNARCGPLMFIHTYGPLGAIARADPLVGKGR
jgi:D-cysteine desulfhydrase